MRSKAATLPRALDYANLFANFASMRIKSGNFASCAMLSHFISVRGCKVRGDVSLYLAFVRSTTQSLTLLSLYLAFVRFDTRILVKGCKVRLAMCHFTSRCGVRSTTRILAKCVWGCHFTSRSCARPRESL